MSLCHESFVGNRLSRNLLANLSFLFSCPYYLPLYGDFLSIISIFLLTWSKYFCYYPCKVIYFKLSLSVYCTDKIKVFFCNNGDFLQVIYMSSAHGCLKRLLTNFFDKNVIFHFPRSWKPSASNQIYWIIKVSNHSRTFGHFCWKFIHFKAI